MNARVLFILLIVTALLAMTQRWRRAGMALSTVLLLLIIWQMFNALPIAPPVTTQAASSATTSMPMLAASESVQLLQAQLTGNGAPWRISGELHNQSAQRIIAVKLHLERRSCTDVNMSDDACNLIWQGDHTLRVTLAASSSQGFEDSVWSHDPVPRATGVIRDRISVAAVQTTATQ